MSSSSSCSESDSDESWSSSAGESESEEELCDYEKRRLDNIRRNQEMMKSLGNTLACTSTRSKSSVIIGNTI